MKNVRYLGWGMVCWAGVFLSGSGGLVEGAEPIRVTTTVTMVTDMVQAVGGSRVKVEGLMGPGVDPHLYKATAADLRKLQSARIIFFSGLHLEGKLQEVLSQVRSKKRKVIAVTDTMPRARLIRVGEGDQAHDPHVWFDVDLWKLGIDGVVRALSEEDPAFAAEYAARAQTLQERMGALHEWCLQKSGELPEQKRILVTSHDAFNYFGRAYGFKVVALQGISTVTEAGLADVTRLVDFVKSNRVKAVFIESSVPPAAMQRIQKDSGAVIGGELFSDAMGTSGQIENGYDLGTYDGMIRHNLTLITHALR